jgi:flagellin-specific chaperone FliS
MYRAAYRTQAQEYREQEILGASPIHLVVMTYDVALLACERQDKNRALQAVTLLRDALNFDYPEAAGLFSLYQWCLDCLRKDDYTNCAASLRPLREAWYTIEKREAAVAVSVPVSGAYASQLQAAGHA